MNSDFLLQLLSTDFIKDRINKIGEGGVRIYVWYPLFSTIKINLPSLEEQTKIATFLSSLDDKITQLQQQLTSYRQFKKALLQQMFV